MALSRLERHQKMQGTGRESRRSLEKSFMLFSNFQKKQRQICYRRNLYCNQSFVQYWNISILLPVEYVIPVQSFLGIKWTDLRLKYRLCLRYSSNSVYPWKWGPNWLTNKAYSGFTSSLTMQWILDFRLLRRCPGRRVQSHLKLQNQWPCHFHLFFDRLLHACLYVEMVYVFPGLMHQKYRLLVRFRRPQHKVRSTAYKLYCSTNNPRLCPVITDLDLPYGRFS